MDNRARTILSLGMDVEDVDWDRGWPVKAAMASPSGVPMVAAENSE
jgi:hypothetical protein